MENVQLTQDSTKKSPTRKTVSRFLPM